MKIIIGSYALNYAGINFRKAKDCDIWISENENKEFFYKNNQFLNSEQLITDIHIVPEQLIENIPVHTNSYIATPDSIYTIKCSHLGWDINWYKHKWDIIYLKSIGCKLIEDLYTKLIKYWENHHGDKKHLSLNKTKEEFFNDNINYIYDHDLLHEIVARPYEPIYKSVLQNNQQVLIDKKKFFKLSKNLQIELFREEIKTIALERFLIPSKFKIGEYKAYLLALKKTITNLTKNWATQFIVENLSEFNSMENSSWCSNFKNT